MLLGANEEKERHEIYNGDAVEQCLISDHLSFKCSRVTTITTPGGARQVLLFLELNSELELFPGRRSQSADLKITPARGKTLLVIIAGHRGGWTIPC